MRLRRTSALLLIMVVTVACSTSPSGPTRPAAPDQVMPDDATKAAGARAVAAAFVRVYALHSSPDVEGIVTFPAQAAADGPTVRMTFRGPGGVTALEIPLQDLIHPLGIVSGSPSPSPNP